VILSVVIPTHNKLPLLRQTLAALGRQDAGAGRSWEVVVVDDGSSDGTGAWLAAGAAALVPALHVVTPPANVGRARARNLGARAARGRWLLFLDDDIVAPPGLLAAHLDVLEAHPDCGTIGWARTAETVRDAPHFHYLDTRGVARLAEGPAPARFFVTQNAAVPREAFLAVGGFDEAFRAYGFEDMEVAFRLEDRAHIRFRALPAPVPDHVHHHTLAEYLAKKVACGASLDRLVVTHPGRLAEMRLEAVLGGGGPEGALVRAVADTPLAGLLERLLGVWPADRRHRPRLARLHGALLSLAVVCCFRRGWRALPQDAKQAQ
jgi:glycosyltransferase involved in cell wall biosynthesis